MTYKQIYETSAVNTGGRQGLSYLTDGAFEVKTSQPGSKAEGVNPEQLFAMGYAACYNGALGVAQAEAGKESPSHAKVTIGLLKGEGPDFKLQATIEVGIKDLDLQEVQSLAERGHEICPYSKAVAENIEVEVKAVAFDPALVK